MGHLALRKALQKETIDPIFCGAPVFAQFSSLGALDDKWLHKEFQGTALCAGRYQASESERPQSPLILPPSPPQPPYKHPDVSYVSFLDVHIQEFSSPANCYTDVCSSQALDK